METKETITNETKLLSLLSKIESEAGALALVRLMVNRPGVKNGVSFEKFWKHPSWTEIDRLRGNIVGLLLDDPALGKKFDASLDMV